MDYTWHVSSPLGGITLASNGEALTGLWFDGQKYFGSTLSADHKDIPLPIFVQTERWLSVYFSGRKPDFTPKLHLFDTPFRLTVWNCLLKIPYGETITYAELADRTGWYGKLYRGSARAIGGALGRNPVSLIVPCHRVVGADGSLTGYAGGLERKQFLLHLESKESGCAPQIPCAGAEKGVQ